VMQFECGTRILRVIHGRDARATLLNCITTGFRINLNLMVRTCSGCFLSRSDKSGQRAS
jgi:hypothetical protein